MNAFQRKPDMVIDDLKTLQVISHPLRSQLLDHFGAEPQTVKQVATKMGLAANKLYYHVNLLEQHGLLSVVETRTVGNMIEKLYNTAAERFELDADLFSFSTHEGQERAEQFVVTSIDATRQDLLRSMEARHLQRARGGEVRPSQAMVTRCTSRLPEERADAFRQRLRALLEEFGEADVTDGAQEIGVPADGMPEANVETYALTVVFYVSFDFPE